MELSEYKNSLAHLRFDSKDARRRYKEDEDSYLFEVIDPFSLDFNKTLQSKAYRRLVHKAQVIPLPDNPHVRTRAIHTYEVISIATTISEVLGLNTPLCRAISACHDMGHPPFGHLGERFINSKHRNFKHNVNGIVIAQHVEREGKGLNLCFQTLEGILYHARGYGELSIEKPIQEYAVVMFADKFAYIPSDIEDLLRNGYLQESDLPKVVSELGENRRKRVERCVCSLIEESSKIGEISFKYCETAKMFDETRRFMTDVYLGIDKQEQTEMLERVYNFLEDHFPGKDPAFILSLMTDKEVEKASNLLQRKKSVPLEELKNFGIMEIVPHLKEDVNYYDLDLSW